MGVVALHPTVVLSGATGAIGSTTAALLVRRGVHVIALARPSKRLDALVKRLDGPDNRISSVPVDLSHRCPRYVPQRVRSTEPAVTSTRC